MPIYLSSASSELCSETSERSLAWVLVSNLQVVHKFLLQHVLIMDGKQLHSVSVLALQLFRRWTCRRTSASLNHYLVSRTQVLSDTQRGGHRLIKHRGGFHQRSQEMMAPGQKGSSLMTATNSPGKACSLEKWEMVAHMGYLDNSRRKMAALSQKM